MTKPPVSSAAAPLQSTVPLESVSESQRELQSQPPMTHVKTEPLKFNELPVSALPHPISESVNGLCNLSTAIQEFKRRLDELENHLDFIQASVEIEEQLAAGDVAVTSKCELQSICETMCARSLRRYIISHLDEAQKLREQVPSALKTAPQPAKLVLDCIGRFYLQGSRAYSKDSPMIPAREASILALELLLLTIEGELQIDDLVRQETVQAAVNWRKRLVIEGGIRKANEIDAKGLLLFVTCYGIPKVFKNEDIWDLVLAGNAGQVAKALRRSGSLVSRVSEIIEQAMSSGLKQNAKLEAVDVASSFGIDDKFTAQKLLTAYLQESEETLKRRKREANNLPTQLKQANERHLTALKTVMKFLRERNLDPLKVVPAWQLTEKITKLEEENANLSRTILETVTIKERADENDFLDKTNPAIKCLRVTGQVSNLLSSPSAGLYEQKKAAAYVMDSRSPFNSSIRVDIQPGGLASFGGDRYPSATLTSYSSAGVSLHENVGGSSFGAGCGLRHDASVNIPGAYGIPTAGNLSTSSVGREGVVDRPVFITGRSNGVAYGGVGNEAPGQSYVRSRTYGLFGPSPLMEGFPGLLDSPPPVIGATINVADLFRFVDAVVESDYNGRVGDYHQ
ncbi:Protein FRIGIDA [Linum perenne]